MEELDLEVLEEIGKFTRKIRKEVSKIPKEGVGIKKIIDFIEKKIFDMGYIPAFPATVSINEQAAHSTVYDNDVLLKKGDLIKIDFGVCHNGFITDNAFTMEIETNKHEKLMRANFEGLNKALEIVKIGTTMSEIGKEVKKIADKYGFNTIQNLAGHQISKYNLHSGLSVPNYENGNLEKVTENIELAIEPFFTYGTPKVKNVGGGNILHLVDYKPVRDVIAKKVLEYIKKNFFHLPFSKRWLVDEYVRELRGEEEAKRAFSLKKVNYAVKILKLHGIIIEYDILSTEDNSMVSQFEDTVVFMRNKKSIITRL